MTSGHLTGEAIARWRENRLSPRERLDTVRHLGECASCRELAGSASGGERLEAAFETGDTMGEHPGYLDLEALADGQADPVAHDLLLLHLKQCEVCTADYRDLTAFRDSIQDKPQERRRIRWVVPAGIALAAAALVLAVVVERASKPGPVAAVDKHVDNRPAMALVVSVRDAGTMIGLDFAGRFEGLASVPAQDRDLLRQVLQTRTLSSSPEAAKLQRRREVRLDGAPASASLLQSLEPAGTVVPSPYPEFRWTAPKAAGRFIVSIYTTNFEPVISSPELAAGGWQPDQPLKAGRTYVWTVSAMVGGRRVTAPQAPEPEALFRIATDEESREFEAAKAVAPGSALLEAAVAARLGMVDSARNALAHLEAANPRSPLVADLSKPLLKP